MPRRLPAILTSLALAACGGAPTRPNAPGARVAGEVKRGAAPKLVVLLVLDQWPEWAFEQKRAALTHGFRRLLTDGIWYIGQHPTPATLTAPGHALLGTGEPPYHSGILANEWWHRDTGRAMTSTEGADGALSAFWLRVPGLGDSVAASHTRAKAVSVSLKDRAALLMLGHAGTAIWYDAKHVSFTSNAAPAWLAGHNATHPIAAHLKDVWTPLDAARVAQLSGVPDERPGEGGMMDFGPAFPHPYTASKDPAKAIFTVPLGNELVLDAALAAIDGEQLGADETPDLLMVSLSAHDYVGHGFGQDSWEMWDLELRLDASIDGFLKQLDAKVGAGRWAMIVTSDHGACPMPESLHGGRINFETLADAANKAAATELGSGSWIVGAKYPTIYLSNAALALPPKTRAAALHKILLALRSFPGIARAGISADYTGHCETRSGDAQLICKMLDPERSGEIFYLPAPGWVMQEADEPVATAHGSLNAYDRLVPVIMLPPGRSATREAAARPEAELVNMERIAPILASWLGVASPTTLPRPQNDAPPAAMQKTPVTTPQPRSSSAPK